MRPNKISHYCQKCMAGNPLGEEFCGRCGTRLMLVVEPRAARFEAEESAGGVGGQDEHVLERVSALEDRLLRVMDRMEKALDLMLRQAQNSQASHMLIETLIAVLAESGIVEPERVRELWRERVARDEAERLGVSDTDGPVN